MLDAIVKRGKLSAAARTVAYGRACFTWAGRRGKVADNPFRNVPIRTATASRDRTLSNAEVALVWDATGKLGWPFGPLFRVLLLTAQRRSEVGEMRWSELSADGETWTIPKERSKNARAHVVHLAPAVRAILAEAPRIELPLKRGQTKATLSDLVFTTNGTTPVSGFQNAKERLDLLTATAAARVAGITDDPIPPELLAQHALPGWRLHDFRRTAVTWMAENGVPPHVADRILNHVSGTISGVAAVYQRGEFLGERRDALEKWGSGLTKGEKAMRRRRSLIMFLSGLVAPMTAAQAFANDICEATALRDVAAIESSASILHKGDKATAITKYRVNPVT